MHVGHGPTAQDAHVTNMCRARAWRTAGGKSSSGIRRLGVPLSRSVRSCHGGFSCVRRTCYGLHVVPCGLPIGRWQLAGYRYRL